MRMILIVFSMLVAGVASAQELRLPQPSEIRAFRNKAFWVEDARVWFRPSFHLTVIERYLKPDAMSRTGLYRLNPPFICITFGGPYECFVVWRTDDKPTNYVLRSPDHIIRLDTMRNKNPIRLLK